MQSQELLERTFLLFRKSKKIFGKYGNGAFVSKSKSSADDIARRNRGSHIDYYFSFVLYFAINSWLRFSAFSSVITIITGITSSKFVWT
jgi:hypothetical protein